MAKRSVVAFLSLLICFIGCSPVEQEKQTNYPEIESFFPQKKTEVLVAGSFHFDYPNLDAVKVKEEDQINLLNEPYKQQVTELVEYLKKFKPTKVAIEASESWKATERLRAYNKGEYSDEVGERFQLGLRIASETGLDTIYSINQWSMSEDIKAIDTSYYNKVFEGYDYQSNDPAGKQAMEWYKASAFGQLNLSLLEYFKYTNSSIFHRYGYGVYLTGDFKLDNNRGADALAINWYNRNLRIFRQVQKMTESTEDRILIIIGNGHAAVLRHLIEASPEFEFVEFEEMDNP